MEFLREDFGPAGRALFDRVRGAHRAEQLERAGAAVERDELSDDERHALSELIESQEGLLDDLTVEVEIESAWDDLDELVDRLGRDRDGRRRRMALLIAREKLLERARDIDQDLDGAYEEDPALVRLERLKHEEAVARARAEQACELIEWLWDEPHERAADWDPIKRVAEALVSLDGTDGLSRAKAADGIATALGAFVKLVQDLRFGDDGDAEAAMTSALDKRNDPSFYWVAEGVLRERLEALAPRLAWMREDIEAVMRSGYRRSVDVDRLARLTEDVEKVMADLALDAVATDPEVLERLYAAD